MLHTTNMSYNVRWSHVRSVYVTPYILTHYLSCLMYGKVELYLD